MKKFNEAQKNVDYLSEVDTQKATALQNYIAQVSDPKFTAVYILDGFKPFLGRGTVVSTLDSDLSVPGSSRVFTMEFTFNKDMDKYSVENPFNWQIDRATGKNKGGPYNWGLPIPETEVNVDPLPKNVIYDASDCSAKLTFTLTQNSSGNSTIDPSHIVFRFYGKDAYGNLMDPNGDKYIGISKIV